MVFGEESDFVQGRPGTEEFVLGFLLLPLSWDKGTAEQEIIFVPGQRDYGTSHPLETLLQTHIVSLAKKEIFRHPKVHRGVSSVPLRDGFH